MLFFALVVPDNYSIFESNQFDSNFQCLQDPQCRRVVFSLPQDDDDDDKKRSSGDQTLLSCGGPNSTLFDGVIGRRGISRARDFEQADFLQHYTWQQDITPEPSIEMSFNVPLVEVPNITMYFFREGRVRVPRISMCFSRTLNFSPCNDIELPNRPGGLNNGLVVWPITLLTNATSVTYLRIDMQYDRNDDNEFTFLSEIRIAERLQGIVMCVLLDAEL